MQAAVDSSLFVPSLQQAQAARAAGVRVWFGYLATVGGPGAFNLEGPWPQQGFDTVRAAGLVPGAFCSGLDDPVRLAALARQWGIPLLLLDCEDGIRGDGAWVDPFLQAAGCGLYGLQPVHWHRAPYRIVADYPGFDPGQPWPSVVAPAEPHGWQWQGTHDEFGGPVDRSWLTDRFGGEMILGPDDLQAIVAAVNTDVSGPPANLFVLKDTFNRLFNSDSAASVVSLLQAANAKLDALAQQGGALTPAQAQQLADVQAAVTRIEAALRVA